MGLKISIAKKEEENVVIISLSGSLDTQTYEEFRKKAQAQLSTTLKAIVLDLERLDYISSMGISAILEIRKAAKAQGVVMMMSSVPEHIDKVFKIVNALPDVQIFENREDADRYFGIIQNQVKEEKRYREAGKNKKI
ncbi:MAG: hypothetical protein A2Y00_04150 [Omnitrophica WOR_2 bacterium GWF2_43_52]|nr:MAG: hypothetical protein A2062_05055 [Omnitrophica WOR_2 bacterium GWA2_44_7]OGX22619.1 MAG: hypothetical protein A2Y00_04150 [Omnitrophica WOR_2 bacterium GWF2_43_52]OGX52836.1 MAG: hypothetical protein A2460_07850 [Omnitrophica WOR_2 bacterium RIFOXYC2_FULL_43_9]HAH21738.1 anti-sigma factor antagonist [Candidatus Omnitrophota bacterium]HBG64715.1 anti-sigma factor antagonist [Candidatus Omnitrophota bacterium]